MGVVELVVVAIWIMLPAYLPNNVAVIAGGGRPIDGGQTFRGARLLGDGKTWRGTAAGIGAGVLTALVLNAGHEAITTILGVGVPVFALGAIVGLPVGAMLGDILASFIKRRTGRERGASFPLVDQLDFVVVALGLTAILSPTWTVETFTLPLVVVIIVITPILHITTNVLAYILGLKAEPW